MAINKVVYGNSTLIDLTDSTVDPEHLAEGYIAYDASGTRIVGELTGGAAVITDEPDSHGGTIRHITTDVIVSGTKTITSNGKHDVSNYAYADVSVGQTEAPQKQINFIDYDGTILHSYTSDEWEEVTTLPANPTHTGLVAQGWNWTKAEIDSQLVSAPGGDVWVGQMYITESGDTEIDITLDSEHLSPYLAVAVSGSITVDWGDNSATTTVTGTSATTIRYTLHEYASAGDYTITLHVESGTLVTRSSSTGKGGLLSAHGSNSNREYNRLYSRCVSAIRLGGNTLINNNAFCNCYSLQSITIPDNVTSIGANAFYQCYSLRSITIPSGLTSLQNATFQTCYSLQSITTPASITSIGVSTFQNCRTLTSITIPNSVTSIGTAVFQYCYFLQSIVIPDSVTSIETSMFQYCYLLQSIVIPDSVTSIGDSAFSNCYSLQSITIPDSVTSIDNSIFTGCYALTSIEIPYGVTSIGNTVFQSCYGMEEYHFLPTTPPTLGTSAFSGIVSDTIIYVPQGSLEAYQTATNWSSYASYMQEE